MKSHLDTLIFPVKNPIRKTLHFFKDDFAYEVFRVNVELFPSSCNAYDSYGEILLKMGRKEEAIKMYEKSLVLNPANDNGKKMLEQIRQ